MPQITCKISCLSGGAPAAQDRGTGLLFKQHLFNLPTHHVSAISARAHKKLRAVGLSKNM